MFLQNHQCIAWQHLKDVFRMSRVPQDPILAINQEIQEQAEQVEFELTFFEALLKRDPSNIRVLVAQAENFSLIGSYNRSLPLDIRLTRLRPERPVFWYNLACSHARLKHVDEAFKALDEAVQRGYDDFPHLLRDSDLKPLRSDPRFAELIRRHKASISLPRKNTRPST